MHFSQAYKKLRIVFMGTPDFAVASLDGLVQAGCTIVAVITSPDKAAGRGMALQQSAVKKYAVAKGLQVLQPEKLRNTDFLQTLKGLHADLQVCVAFRMLPEVVWNMPPMGTINLHGSLLPQYRGAAPINRAIMNGATTTGVTTFKLRHDIDTGNILEQTAVSITEEDTAGTVHDSLMHTGAALLLHTVKGMADGTLKESPQLVSTNTTLHHAPKIFAEDCVINFEKPIDEVHNFIRGLSPYPAAFTYLDGKKLKIFKTIKKYTATAAAPASVLTDGKTQLAFACRDGLIEVQELQLEGKKRMLVADFLRGYRFNPQQ